MGNIPALAAGKQAFRRLRLECELLCAKRKWSRIEHTDQKIRPTARAGLIFFGRSVEIRTPGLQYPKLARYQLRYTSKLLFILYSLCHYARFSARPRWRSLLKHSRTAREDKPHSHYSLFLRIRYSLLLGHVRGLTVHRTVIQYPHAASLRQKQHSVVFVCSQLRYTSKYCLIFLA